MNPSQFSVVDLFSGAGGMSFGFHKHSAFEVIAAADAELGKPSAGTGALQCNSTFSINLGITPTQVDLSSVEPKHIRKVLGLRKDTHVSVLSACPPCTGFSRANPTNHLEDDDRNSLVRRSAQFALHLGADVLLMENARELLNGNFRHHFDYLKYTLEKGGYKVFAKNYMLSNFGLPQIRERSIVIAVKKALPLHTLDDIWEGWGVRPGAITVRHALNNISERADANQTVPDFSSDVVRRRMEAIPHDGGSWIDLLKLPDADELMTNAMKKIVGANRIGSYPDVYGRMAWSKPAPTIKRECAHVGNGRYAHPEEDRLLTVREMAILQGFPNDFSFNGATVSNMYRHIGDAVPPLISHQLAHLAAWILTGKRPTARDVTLKGTNLRKQDIVRLPAQAVFDDQIIPRCIVGRKKVPQSSH